MAISSRQLSFSAKKLLLSRARRSAADYKVITSSTIFLRSHVLAKSAQLLIITWSYRCCQSKYKFVKFLIGRGSQTSKLYHSKTTTTNLCLAGYGPYIMLLVQLHSLACPHGVQQKREWVDGEGEVALKSAQDFIRSAAAPAAVQALRCNYWTAGLHTASGMMGR